jgi:rhamnulokinase
VLGPLRSSAATDTGIVPIPVIAPATHDTGSAIAAVPVSSKSWAYISSGTWSLMGVELAEPLINEGTLSANFTNEGGVAGTTRLLKNIMGLWLVQECRRAWEKAGKTYSYEQLTKLAESAPPYVSVIDPDDPRFMLPSSMPAAIVDYCREKGQPAPTDPGPVVRCCLESLALKYRWTLRKLEELIGKTIDVIHVIGGGCQNALLCQWTADACGVPVLAGPVEATALGNILMQAIGLGLIGNISDGREVIRGSVELAHYEPHNTNGWRELSERFGQLVSNNS